MADSNTGLSSDFKAGSGERTDVYAPSQTNAPVQQYQPGRFELNPYLLSSYLSGPFGVTQEGPQNPYQPQSVPVAQQVSYDPSAELQAKLAGATTNRPAAAPVELQKSNNGIDFSNIKPDMLLDPGKAGWELYSSNPRSNPYGLLGGDNSMGGIFGRINRSLFSPPPAGSYTDSQGNVWVRKT
jgi:hypothetical protein